MGFTDSLKAKYTEKAFMADAKVDIDKIAMITMAGYGLTVLGFIMFLPVLMMHLQFIYGPIAFLFPILVLLLGIILSVYSELTLNLKLSQRKYLIEKELPFVSIFITLTSALGLPLSRAFKEARRIGFFKAFKRELNFLEKIKMFYILSDIDAVEFIGRFHPSSQLREFYQVLVASERSGGDKYRILYERSTSLIKMLEDRIDRLVERYNTITNLEVIFFIVIPMALITLGALFVGDKGYGLAFTSAVIFPVISFIMLYFIVQAAYPEELVERPPMKVFYSVIAGMIFVSIVIGILSPRILERGLNTYEILGASYIILLSLGGTYYNRWYKQSDDFVFSMSLITRQIAEECKKGKTPRQAIVALAKYKLPKRVESFIRIVIARLSMGVSIQESIRGIKMPWLTRTYFEFLDMADRYGADPKTLDMLASFTSDTVSVAKIVKDRSLSFKLSSLVAILALVLGFVIVSEKVLKQFALMGQTLLSQGGTAMISIPLKPLTPDMLPGIKNISYIGIILNTVFIALLTGKTTKGSMSAGLLLGAILTIISLVSIRILAMIM